MVVLLCVVGVLGGYGVGQAADAVRGVLAGSEPGLPADKVAPPEPIDLTGPATTCRSDAVDLTLSAASPTVQLGDPLVFSVRVTNTGRVPCLFDGGEASRTVTVTDPSAQDGARRVWSSGACAEGETMLLLGVEHVAAHDLRWRTDGADACGGEQPQLEPGTYEARAQLGDVPGARSKPVTITVVAPPEPTPAETDAKDAAADGDDAPAGGDGSADDETADDETAGDDSTQDGNAKDARNAKGENAKNGGAKGDNAKSDKAKDTTDEQDAEETAG